MFQCDFLRSRHRVMLRSARSVSGKGCKLNDYSSNDLKIFSCCGRGWNFGVYLDPSKADRRIRGTGKFKILECGSRFVMKVPHGCLNPGIVCIAAIRSITLHECYDRVRQKAKLRTWYAIDPPERNCLIEFRDSSSMDWLCTFEKPNENRKESLKIGRTWAVFKATSISCIKRDGTLRFSW